MVLDHTLISSTWFFKVFTVVIMVLSFPYSITAFLQLLICFANCFAKWYDPQHEWTVLKSTASPGKIFRLKVEAMPTFRLRQYINEFYSQIIGSEPDITIYLEKHVPAQYFIIQSNMTVTPHHYLFSNPYCTLH